MLSFGTQNKFRRSVEAHRPKLYRLACSWCHNKQLAEDLVQDTCVKAFERSSQLKDPAKLSGWLARILVNLHRDHLRRERDLLDVDDLTLVDDFHPGASAERLDTASFVRAAVAKLPPEQRKVLTLVDLSEFTYAEVSTVLEIPIGTVMSRLCRARRQLKKQLDEPKHKDIKNKSIHKNTKTIPSLRRIK